MMFQNVANNDATTWSHEHKKPFIELNGAEYADSTFIIDALITHFHKEDMDSHLSAEEKAVARAFDHLIEEQLFWLVPCT